MSKRPRKVYKKWLHPGRGNGEGEGDFRVKVFL